MKTLLRFLALSLLAAAAAELRVLSVEREVDISTQLVKVTSRIDLENGGSAPASEFRYPVDQAENANLAFLSATATGKEDADDEQMQFSQGAKENGAVMYTFTLSPKLKAGGKTTIVITSVFTHLLKPFPTHIQQADQQKVEFNGNAYQLSAYKVGTQQTTVKLASEKVEFYTAVEPSAHNGDTITYGPYKDVEPMARKDIRVHAENNSPFLAVAKLERLVEVSHWGNVAVEETLELEHRGAILRGSFSRFDFQRDQRGDAQPCVKSFKTVLPAAAADVYYRDEIGNISTSNLRVADDAVEMEIRPRFPLFGGWKSNYYIGYNVRSHEYLYSKGNDFVLKMRFVDHVFDSFVIDEMTLKVILPEHSKNVKLQTPFKVRRSSDQLHYTYLDISGRPVVLAHKSNVVENHIQDFELHYSFDRAQLVREPLMIIIAFYLLFLVVIVWVRLDFTIATDPASESRQRVQGMVDLLAEQQARRSAAYDALLAAAAAFKASKDAGAFAAARKKADADMRAVTQQIADLQTEIKAESGETADKVGDLARLDKAVKEQLGALTQLTERLVSGKVQKGAFADADKVARAKLDDARDKIDQLLLAL